MEIVFAAITAFGGLVALLAGGDSLRRARRILAAGEPAVALVKRGPPGSGRQVLQFETADGRLLEVVSPVTLTAGSSVLLSYDPVDPREVALPGHGHNRLDLGFVLVGLSAVLVGAVMAAAAL
ncbi:hypothetical protein ABZ707_00755 [Streptomyces sp. NPDC006923]|uniref:hypothetical protein n=1 Tax=Streptomyces sp. NPDC006923 TaxID=3155355 RepID=UPI0033E2524C